MYKQFNIYKIPLRLFNGSPCLLYTEGSLTHVELGQTFAMFTANIQALLNSADE